jgi:hypothetical protein
MLIGNNKVEFFNIKARTGAGLRRNLDDSRPVQFYNLLRIHNRGFKDL